MRAPNCRSSAYVALSPGTISACLSGAPLGRREQAVVQQPLVDERHATAASSLGSTRSPTTALVGSSAGASVGRATSRSWSNMTETAPTSAISSVSPSGRAGACQLAGDPGDGVRREHARIGDALGDRSSATHSGALGPAKTSAIGAR